MVSENTLHDYWQSDDGPVVITSLGFGIALRPVVIGVRVGEQNVRAKAERAAAEVLSAHGWSVTGPWQLVGACLHALVERVA